MTLVDDFIHELETVRSRFADRPEEELVWHMLLALEREEVVSVAYREAVIDRRLDAMPINAEVRDLIHQALVWAWKDEQMHARYVHGAIIRLRNPLLRLTALTRQTNGLVAGWATAVQHHSRPDEAPISRAIARAIIMIGELLGQVPEDLRTQIRYQPFRDYCLLNVELEKTAGIGWSRAADVAEAAGIFPQTLVADFRRIVQDEQRHEAVFGLFAEVLDDQDRLRPNVSAETILDRLRAIGEQFIPRRHRSLATPIGQGGLVVVAKGERRMAQGGGGDEQSAISDQPAPPQEALTRVPSGCLSPAGERELGADLPASGRDPAVGALPRSTQSRSSDRSYGDDQMERDNPFNPLTKSVDGSIQPSFESVLRRADLVGLLAERARERRKRLPELSIAIKTSFMLGYDRRDRGTHVDPAVVAALAAWLGRWGCRDVCLIEGPNLYDWYFQNRTVAQVAEYLGYRSPYYRVVDAGLDQVPHHYPHGLGQHTISRTWRDADVRIVVGKAKSNPTEHLCATIASLENLGERVDSYLFPERQVQIDTATMMILADLPPDFALLDAYADVPDGLVGMLGSRHTVAPGRFYAGRDALAVDSVAAEQFGLADPRRTNLLSTAYAWFGDPRSLTIVDGPDTPVTGWSGPFSDDLSTLLSLPALPVYQYLSGRGSLFTPPMDPVAFPPKSPVPLHLRLGRALVRRAFGIAPPHRNRRHGRVLPIPYTGAAEAERQ